MKISMHSSVWNSLTALFRLNKIIAAFAVLFLFGTVTAVQAAGTPIGTVIGNQASATYTDASNVTRTATSNLVTTIVQQVASFTLTASQSQFAAPGGEVVYPHTLTNTGNGTDTFDLSVVNAGGDDFNLNNLFLYADANGDGIADNNIPITSTGPLAADGIFRFVAVGNVPGVGVVAGNTALITVSAVGNAAAATAGGYTAATTQTNTDTTTVTGNAVIRVTKAISQSSGASPSGPFTYTLTYTNAGNATATGVRLTDLIPTGMTYVAGSGRWSVTGATVLTDANAADNQGGIIYDFNVTTERSNVSVPLPVLVKVCG